MNKSKLNAAAPLLYDALRDLVRCIRDGQLGDYSPLMDEIFDAEAALSKAQGRRFTAGKVKRTKQKQEAVGVRDLRYLLADAIRNTHATKVYLQKMEEITRPMSMDKPKGLVARTTIKYPPILNTP